MFCGRLGDLWYRRWRFQVRALNKHSRLPDGDRTQIKHLTPNCRAIQRNPAVRQRAPQNWRARHCRPNRYHLPHLPVLLLHDQRRRLDGLDLHDLRGKIRRVLAGFLAAHDYVLFVSSCLVSVSE